jgi:2-iminobutanoate/2-iminopropanoate deaminase
MSDDLLPRPVYPADLVDPVSPRVGYKSPAVIAGAFIFLSGQVGIDVDGAMPPSVDDQVRNIWRRIDLTLRAVGGSLTDVVSTTTFLLSMDHVWVADDVKRELFTDFAPANAAIGVASLPYGAAVEIQAVAIHRGSTDPGSVR